MGKRDERYVVGFSYGWEWLSDVMRGGEVYATERERDLAIKALADYEDAIDPTVEQIMREFHGTEQRGLPQDGEGV